jgi:hypothetical protein
VTREDDDEVLAAPEELLKEGDWNQNVLKLSQLEKYSKSELLPLVSETYGVSEEQAERWVVEALVKGAKEREEGYLFERPEELLALADGPFKVLRDDTFADPERVLLWDKQGKPVVKALTFAQLLEQYQCGGRLSQWAPQDLEELKKAKRECLGQTLDSYNEQERGSKRDDLVCSTPCFLPSENRLVAHQWVVVSACLD